MKSQNKLLNKIHQKKKFQITIRNYLKLELRKSFKLLRVIITLEI